MSTEPQKCNVIGCERTGTPTEGFDFYVCDECLDELARLLEAEGARRAAIHEAN